MRTIKGLIVPTVEQIKGMLAKLYDDMETGATDIQRARACRDLLLTGLLACHMLRISALMKMRFGGNRDGITLRDGRWYLKSYPEDSKIATPAVSFPLMSHLIKAHELWIGRYRSVLAGDGIDNGRYLVCNCGRAMDKADIRRQVRAVTKRLLGKEVASHRLRAAILVELGIDGKIRRTLSILCMRKHVIKDRRLIGSLSVEKEVKKIDKIWNKPKGA